MKVKFYKGPWHNKVRYLRDYETQIVVADGPSQQALSVYTADQFAPITITKHLYIKSNFCYPDGSVFFVYQGKY